MKKQESAQFAALRDMMKKKPLSKNLKVSLRECADSGREGSIGAFYIANSVREAGFKIDVLPYDSDKSGYDVELLSVHHANNWHWLASLPKRAGIRILGGHAMSVNPRPGIPMSDVICVGEGETWIKNVLSHIESGKDIRDIAMPGTIVSSEWEPCMSIPDLNIEDPLPNNPPYLNWPGTLSARWYVEIARGCPFSCKYCEMGNSLKYRYYSKEDIFKTLKKADMSVTRKINFFAPDESSHPDYFEMIEYLQKHKYNQGFGSYRIDQILRKKVKVYSMGQTIRVGVDGMTEATRKKVGKNISDKMLIEFFLKMTESGYMNFKIFMIIGYPWDKFSDFKVFKKIINKIANITKTGKNKSLRIKWTPFIPQPRTPMKDVKAVYDHRLVNEIESWHEKAKNMYFPEWSIIPESRIMSMKSHQRQICLTNANEYAFIKKSEYVNEKWRTLK